MKMSHKLTSAKTAGPLWGVVFGIFMSMVGLGLWIYAQSSVSPTGEDESVAVVAIMIGVLMTVYATRELTRTRR
jgi:hypothetical protein